jgi:uncharacterized protein YbjT (DUF2867 family)
VQGDPRNVLVTGPTGTLGRHVVAEVEERGGATARILSRRERPPDAPGGREWVRADLSTDSLDVALQGIDAVLHLASAKGPGDADVRAAGRLLEAARQARVRHFVFISIIGCDRIPLPFYASKMRIESAIRASGVPWSIVRVAQFHSFVDRLVRAAATLPVPTPIAADLRFQPVDEREVAGRLAAIALGPPLGNAPAIAGPEVLTLGEIAQTWLTVMRRPGTLLPMSLGALGDAESASPQAEPWARAVLEGYRAAFNTPQGPCSLGTVRFADWLRAYESRLRR